jgi:ammonium transporter Rh
MTDKYITQTILTFQALLFIGYYLFTDYSNEATGTINGSVSNDINKYYPFFQDVHVMIFIGFGYLMTFLKKYAFTSVGYTFLIGSFIIQYSILVNGLFHNIFMNHYEKIYLNIESLITGDFTVGAILISFGALLGKLSLSQLFFMSIIEVILYSVNESIGVIKYQAVDMGGSMYVHTFGAYFGLAVSYVVSNNKKLLNNKDESSDKNSDTFAMIGTLFLWMFWPSFNGALASGNSQHRVVINTILSLTSSCMASFAISKYLRKNKFNMVDIQNATLAGGVAVGSSADLVIGPSFSMLIGMIAGIVSTLGYNKLQPWLYKTYNLHDTCGVNNLHGIPGIIGGLSGAISAAFTSNELYGDNIQNVFPAMDGTRSNKEQGLYQLLALLTTISISISGGLLTGKILNMRIFQNNKAYYDDKDNWHLEEEEALLVNP